MKYPLIDKIIAKRDGLMLSLVTGLIVCCLSATSIPASAAATASTANTSKTASVSDVNKDLFSRAEYPRPDWVRENPVSLNGNWEFAEDKLNAGEKEGWFDGRKLEKTIVVPFCAESKASGIGRSDIANVIWYKKRFSVEKKFRDGRTVLLNFGAVDYEAKVWLNGKLLGSHEGGYTPFSFDISSALADGENVLAVRVFDTNDRQIPRGKQTTTGKSEGIFYTTVSGIWQPVWLESAGASHLTRADIRTDALTGWVNVSVEYEGKSLVSQARFTVSLPEGKSLVFEKPAIEADTRNIASADFSVDKYIPWTPAYPKLYPLTLELLDKNGATVDRVDTYFALRSIEVNGRRILLNGLPLYLKFMLDQGYYPGGVYTPTDAALFRADIEQGKAMGFNGVRMHQKIEDPRFLFWADALGYLMWEEMPSAFTMTNKMRHAIKSQWAEAITRDRNHPCIITWVPFNENWGVYDGVLRLNSSRDFVKEMFIYTKELDPTRPVVDNSGFEHVMTDIVDLHPYIETAAKARKYFSDLKDPQFLEYDFITHKLKSDPLAFIPTKPLWPGVTYDWQPMVVSEYGGFGYYSAEKKPLLDNFSEYTLDIARSDLFEGYCYTQQYDVEQEQNGLTYFDRKPKIPIEQIRATNDEVDRIVSERRDYVF